MEIKKIRMTNERKRILLIPMFIFIFINAFFLLEKALLARHGFDEVLLVGGNVFLFILTMIALGIQLKGLNSTNPNVFVRSVYTVMIVKLFIVAATGLVYIYWNRQHLNKRGLFAIMGLYVVYTAFEVGGLMKILRKKNG